MATIRETLHIDTSGAVASLNVSANALEANAKQADRAKDGFGAVGSNAARLGGAASMLDPALGGVVMGLADLADVGEVGAAVMGRLGLSLGTAAAVIGPIALLVAGVAYAWTEYEAEAQAAEAAQKALNDALRDTEAITRATQTAVERYQLTAGQLTQEQADSISINREWDERLKQGTAALEEQAATMRASVGDVGASKEAWAAYDAQLKIVTDAIANATRTNEEGRAAALASAEVARETAESDAVLAARAKAKADADRDAAKAAGERRQEQAALNEEMKLSAEYWFAQFQGAVAAEAKTADVAAQIQEAQIAGELAMGSKDVRVEAAEQLEALSGRAAELGVVVQAANDPIVDLAILLTEVDAAAAKGLGGAAELAAALRAELEGAGRAGDDLHVKTPEEWGRVKAEPASEQVSAVGSSLQSVASGDAIGLLASTGPQGAAAAAVLSGLSAMGEQGADAIADSIRGQIESITAGIEALPELVAELPGILADTAPDLVSALIMAAPELALASVQAQFQLVDYLITKMPGAVGEAIGQELADLWARIEAFLRNPISAMRGDSSNTVWEKLQNTAVDIGRVIAGAATLGMSEVALGIANGATGGGARQALYAGDREEKARTSGQRGAQAAARNALAPSRGHAEDVGGQLWGLLNRSGARGNLRDAAGTPYGAGGSMRLVVQGG